MSVAIRKETANIFDQVKIIDWTPDCHLNPDGTIKAGIYRNMPNHIYHGSEGESSTCIKTLAKTTPLHLKNTYRSSEARKLSAQQRKTFEVGGLYHELTLETKAFYERYHKLPAPTEFKSYVLDDLKAILKERKLPISGSKGALKARINEHLTEQWALEEKGELPEGAKAETIRELIFEYEDAVEKVIHEICNTEAINLAVARYKENPRSSLLNMIKEEDIAVKAGVLPIEHNTWKDVHEMYVVTMADPFARAFLYEGEAELSVFAYCPTTGLLLKCRYDFLNIHGEAIDLKSARSVDPVMFKSDCKKLRYDLQEQFYIRVGNLAGLNVNKFIFVGCEKGDAIVCINFQLGKMTKAKAHSDMMVYLEILRNCIETDTWPAYLKEPRIVTLELY